MSNKDFIIKKLSFRANHRGTKEMDILLGGFFDTNSKNLKDYELGEFQKLLEIDDKALTDYFVMNKKNENIEKIEIVKKIVEFIDQKKI